MCKILTYGGVLSHGGAPNHHKLTWSDLDDLGLPHDLENPYVDNVVMPTINLPFRVFLLHVLPPLHGSIGDGLLLTPI